jgi:transcriptional regulator with XRE-family HTH domain
MKTLNERIKHARTSAKLTQAYVARSVGVSTATASDWESGKIKRIESQNLLKLASLFKVSPTWLQFGTGDMEAKTVIESEDALEVELRTYFSMLTNLQQKEIIDHARALWEENRLKYLDFEQKAKQLMRSSAQNN